MEEIKKQHCCCFTGHRPEKLNMAEEDVKKRLRFAISEAIAAGFYIFITGMARGVDMWAAEIVMEEKKKNENIKLICASPYEGFEKRWSFSEQKRYKQIMDEADSTKFVCEHYVKQCFQIRNCYMVDRSSRVIAAYNGERGGTYNTIRYALRNHVDVKNILISDG